MQELNPSEKLAIFLEKKMAQIAEANRILADRKKPKEQLIKEAQENLERVLEAQKQKKNPE